VNLLILRETLLEELGPAYMWLINLSVVDWVSLSEEDKELNTQMRPDWLASYSKASEAVLQHWCLNRAQAPRPRSQHVSRLQRRLHSLLQGLHRFYQYQCLSTRPHARPVYSRRLRPRHLNGTLPLGRIWAPEGLQGTSCSCRRW